MTGTSSSNGVGGRQVRTAVATRRRTLRSLAGAGTLGLGVALAGCTDGGNGGDGGSNTVNMNDDFEFVPETITVSTGSTITWENVGSVGHSVTAYGEEIPGDAAYFASGGAGSEQQARSVYPDQGRIQAGETYEHTFEVAGTYEYFCIPHESTGMEGTVEVSDE